MKLLLSLLFTFSSLLLASQAVPKFNLEEVATIEVPAAMELQDKAYQKDAQPYFSNLVLTRGRRTHWPSTPGSFTKLTGKLRETFPVLESIRKLVRKTLKKLMR
jgi:hypothetical protein